LPKLILSMGIIAGGLTIGYLLQQLVNSKRLQLPLSLEALRKSLQKGALLFVLPITIASAIWVVRIDSVAMAALPLLGFTAIMLGGLLALLGARCLGLPPHQAGALYGCGSFTNIGSIGALICYLFLGEAGFALVPIYKIFEELTYYGIGFPIAKLHSPYASIRRESWLSKLKAMATDPFILVALSSIVMGALLNLSGIARPVFFSQVNTICIPLGTAMLLISIGLAMKFKRAGRYYRECLTVGLIKFLVVPLTVSSLAAWMGYGQIENGLPLKVVVILTSMPVAFNALIPPSLYDLDLDLANACWFFTTACLVWVLPLLLIITRAI
jgi:predicted permease